MSEKLQQLREKWMAEFKGNPKYKGKTTEELQEIINTIISLAEMYYISISEGR